MTLSGFLHQKVSFRTLLRLVSPLYFLLLAAYAYNIYMGFTVGGSLPDCLSRRYAMHMGEITFEEYRSVKCFEPIGLPFQAIGLGIAATVVLWKVGAALIKKLAYSDRLRAY